MAQSLSSYLIKIFLDASNRLKITDENESKIPISTIVIDIEKIFNEFSCGVSGYISGKRFYKNTLMITGRSN